MRYSGFLDLMPSQSLPIWTLDAHCLRALEIASRRVDPVSRRREFDSAEAVQSSMQPPWRLSTNELPGEACVELSRIRRDDAFLEDEAAIKAPLPCLDHAI